MVIVSHGHEFLDQLCTKTVEIEREATTYKGTIRSTAPIRRQGAQQMVAYEKWQKEVQLTRHDQPFGGWWTIRSRQRGAKGAR